MGELGRLFFLLLGDKTDKDIEKFHGLEFSFTVGSSTTEVSGFSGYPQIAPSRNGKA